MYQPEQTTTDDRISVLLIDDDEHWASYLSEQLTRHEPSLAVTVALSPNEALQQLRNGTSVDCVIAPHGTCGIEGLRLLNRVRETSPQLPFLIVANRRSEQLREVVTADQSTTYLVTGPDAEPLELYVGKITALVSQYRLQQRHSELEQQYERLTKQVTEAVAIVQNETLVYWNRALRDLTGYDDSQLNTMYPVTELFHPADRTAVREQLTDWANSEAAQSLETRLYTEQNEARYCTVTGQSIQHERSQAVLVTLQDNTESRQRKRKLEWETDLNRSIQQALLDSETRAEMEQRICTQLCRYGYELAWTGNVSEDTLTPQVVAGDDPGDIQSRSYETAGQDDAAPSVWAARLREPQFINNLTDMLDAQWQQRALKAGYRSGGAVPLVYQDVFYGVLVVYHSNLNQFDETEQTLLCSLGELLAFAIHDFETRQARSSNERVSLQLRVRGSEYYLNDLARSLESRAARFIVHETRRHGQEQIRQYITVEGVSAETFETLATDHTAIESVTTIETRDQTARYQLVVEQETPQSRLAALGAIVTQSVVRIDGAEVAIELPKAIDAAETIDTLRQRFDISAESITESRSGQSTPNQYSLADVDALTDKQEAALSAAFHHGYFERPRKSTAKEIATTLDISHSTFLQHLRVAEQKVFDDLSSGGSN